MSEFYTAKINDKLKEAYFEMFGDYDYGIPHLPSEVAFDSKFLEQAVQDCLDAQIPMSMRLHEYFPKRYEAYKKTIDDGCFL